MKKYFWFLIALFLAMADLYAGQDSDLVWKKNLLLLGDEIVRVKFIPSGKPDSSQYLAVGIGTHVQIYDVQTQEIVKDFINPVDRILDFDFSDDMKYLVTSSFDQKIVLWDYEKNDTIKVINDSKAMTKVRFINNSQIICVTSIWGDTNNIQVWDINNWKLMFTNSNYASYAAIYLNKEKNLMAICTDGRVQPEKLSVQLWDLNNFKKIANLGNHNTTITDIAFSPDGKYLASASKDQIIKIWDVNSRTLNKTLIHETLDSSWWLNVQVVFSPHSGNLISSGGGGLEFTTKIWDMKSYKTIYKYLTPNGASPGLDITKDSSFISIGNAYELSVLKSDWLGTDIKQNDLFQKVLYPNPSGNQITIPLESNNTINSINIINSNGIVYKNIDNVSPLSELIRIDISNLMIGVYFVNVKYSNKISSFKFEKIR